MRRLVWSGATALLLLGPMAHAAPEAMTTQAPRPQVDPAVRADVDTLLLRFSAAWNKHDPHAMASLYAADAHLINPMGRDARGRAGVEQLFRDEHAGMQAHSTFSAKVVDVRQVKPDVLFSDMALTITGQRSPSGEVMPPRQLHVAQLLVKDEGTWKLLESRPYEFIKPPGQGVGGSGQEMIPPEPTPSAPRPVPTFPNSDPQTGDNQNGDTKTDPR